MKFRLAALGLHLLASCVALTVKYFSGDEKKLLKQRVRAVGLAADQPNAIALTGRRRPLLVIFDPANVKILRLFKAT